MVPVWKQSNPLWSLASFSIDDSYNSVNYKRPNRFACIYSSRVGLSSCKMTYKPMYISGLYSNMMRPVKANCQSTLQTVTHKQRVTSARREKKRNPLQLGLRLDTNLSLTRISIMVINYMIYLKYHSIPTHTLSNQPSSTRPIRFQYTDPYLNLG